MPEFGLEKLKGNLTVLLLGAFLTDGKRDTGGFMGQSDGGGNFINVLATVATGTGGGDFQVLRLDNNVALDEIGDDGDGGGRGVNTASFFGTGDALDSMGAGFVLELVIGVGAGNFYD